MLQDVPPAIINDVLFPIVSSGRSYLATVRFARLNPKDYPAGRALVLAHDDREVEHILADARFGETIGTEITLPVWIRFMPQQFGGRSYGLALALADKRARYCSNHAFANGRLIATGLMTEDGCGRIGEVDSLRDSLVATAAEALSGDLIVLPRANLKQASQAE